MEQDELLESGPDRRRWVVALAVIVALVGGLWAIGEAEIGAQANARTKVEQVNPNGVDCGVCNGR